MKINHLQQFKQTWTHLYMWVDSWLGKWFGNLLEWQQTLGLFKTKHLRIVDSAIHWIGIFSKSLKQPIDCSNLD